MASAVKFVQRPSQRKIECRSKGLLRFGTMDCGFEPHKVFAISKLPLVKYGYDTLVPFTLIPQSAWCRNTVILRIQIVSKNTV